MLIQHFNVVLFRGGFMIVWTIFQLETFRNDPAVFFQPGPFEGQNIVIIIIWLVFASA